MVQEFAREYPSQPICAVGVVIWKDNAVLLIQRGRAPLYGEWSLPGGAVALGESIRDAARREVREECGIEIELGDVIDVNDFIQHDNSERLQYHYVLVDFAARYLKGILQAASDVMDARWIEYQGLGNYSLNSKTKQVIDKSFSETS